jgi:peptide chain release factor 1
MQFDDTLDMLLRRHEELRDTMARPDLAGAEFSKHSREFSELTPVVETIQHLRAAQAQQKDTQAMLADASLDAELKSMAQEELQAIDKQIPELMKQVQLALLPKDAADEKNAILEVRAGTGGEEAALFAAELFRMYQRYAGLRNWRFEVLSISETGIGGYKEAQASISGQGVFARLKFESGVHRVQRVPATEGGGRIHTSAATVAVLPEAEEVDIHIEEKDLRIDVFRASGPGGQSVNTTDSAVRIVHIPTGITVQQQDEKSQHKNKAKALKVLRARLYEAEREKLANERAANRKEQVGSGDRSERIRTYNFPQGRVSDHRINLTAYNIDQVMEGSGLQEFVEALMADDQARKLREVVAETSRLLRPLDDAALDARLLVQHVARKTYEELLMHPDAPLTDAQAVQLRALTARRAAHEPMAHLLGEKEFWGLPFRVTPDTLIPRPDSETVVEAILAHIPPPWRGGGQEGGEAACMVADAPPPPRPSPLQGEGVSIHILDLGTGSGCLLLALLSELPRACGVGVDINPGALEVAAENACALGLSARAQWRNGDWCGALGRGEKFEIVVANPPYIASNACERLMPDVLHYEPRLALDGGEDGLDCYRILAKQLSAFTKQGSVIALEVGAGQADAVAALFTQAGWAAERIVPDLAGIARCVVITTKDQ